MFVQDAGVQKIKIREAQIRNVRNLFGTDGVRGRANFPPMTVETVVALGRAVGYVLQQKGGGHRVVIGKDTRLSCYMFENALIAGLCSMGIDTLMVGPLPTPGVAYITRAYRAAAGVVISASHNPYDDNGIKFFSPEGFKLNDQFEKEIEKVVAKKSYESALPPSDFLGKNTKIEDAQGRYIEFAKASFPRESSLQGMGVVVDCANGATYRVGPLVFAELGARVWTHGTHPNGLNINDHCGALYPETMAQQVVEKGADVGVAFDGDGDRVIMADEKGRVIDGDQILAICAKDRLERGTLKGKRVVATVMTNLGIVRSLERLGIEVKIASVGDRHVLEEMLKSGALVGGEQSGHLLFLRHNTTGDGIVSALQVLRLMRETKQTLSQLVDWIETYPQVLLSVPVGQRPPLKEIPSVQRAIHEVEQALAGQGRVLVRYSGTQPVCRIMVEGKDQAFAALSAQAIADAIKVAIGA